MNERPRRPGGTSEGGQWTRQHRQESGVRLAEEDLAYNEDGTFEFPPHPRSVGQVIAFWEDVPVSDQVLRQMQRAYVRQQHNWRVGELERWKVDNPQPPATRMLRGANPGHDEWLLALEEQDALLQAQHYPDIAPTLARPLARAAGMQRQVHDLAVRTRDEHLLDEFWNHEVVLDGRPVSMSELLTSYPVHELEHETWVDRSAEASVDTAELLKALVGERE